MHEICVVTVGTNGRSLLTQPMSAVPHAIGMSGQSTNASTTQPQSAFSNSFWTVAQSTSSMLGIAIASASRTPASIPMLTRLRRLTLRGGMSSAPVAVGEVGPELLQRLRQVLLAVRDPGRERRGLHERDELGDAVLAEHRGRGLHRAVVADQQRRGDEEPGAVAVDPVLVGVRIGSAEVVEGDLAAVDHHVVRVEGAVADPGLVESLHVLPRAREHVVGDRIRVDLVERRPVGSARHEHRRLRAGGARSSRDAVRGHPLARRASARTRCARSAGGDCRTPAPRDRGT